MKDRNPFLEADGLHWESDTHEWFNDKTSTQHAHKQSATGTKNDSLKNIHCFVVRDKSTGQYYRVVLDSKKNQVIYETKSLEDLGFFIDRLKIYKRFK
jgi:hypothetical protein